MLPTLTESNEYNSVNSQFNLLDNSTEEIEELSKTFDGSSISERLKKLQNSRNINYSIVDENTDNKSNTKVSATIENFNQNTIKTTNEHPKELYLGDQMIEGDEIDKGFLSKYFENNTNNTPIVKSLNFKNKLYNLLVNSIDRKWNGLITPDGRLYESEYTSRYDYTIYFSPDSNSYIKVPIYENNEYIARNISDPYDLIDIEKGVRDKNTTGFQYNNRTYQPYNISEPKGDVVGYETHVVKSSSDGVSIDKTFKNIKSIKLKKIILPNIDEFHNGSIIGHKSEPYILLHIKEFDSNIISTSCFNKSIFSKVYFDRDYKYEGGRGYSSYLNSDNDIKIFEPSPKGELGKLSIQILRPNGELYSNSLDNIQITGINIKNNEIRLIFNKFIHKNYFKKGDKIIVKSLVEISNLNLEKYVIDYLSKGAYVMSVSNTPTDCNINHINLEWLVTGTKNTGQNIYFNGNQPNITDHEVKAFVLNSSLQNTLVFEVTCQEADIASVYTPELI